jgi:flagellin
MVGSVNTNIGAQIALQNLNVTGADLASVQKQISTGLKVSDAFDNGAVFAIAQGLRSDVKAISTVNGQLGGAKGLLAVATSAATGVSNTFSEIRSVLIQLADQNVTGNARIQLNAQYDTLFSSVCNFVGEANYNGNNLLVHMGAGFGTPSSIANQTKFAPGVYDNYQPGVTFSFLAPQNTNVIQDISANQYTIQGQDFQSYVINKLTNFSDATGAATLLSGNFASAQDYVGTALNALAASSHFLDNQITFNNALSDATEQGLGALVDADLAKESAKLQSLQIKQQLGTQSLGIANQAPQSLLGLFR